MIASAPFDGETWLADSSARFRAGHAELREPWGVALLGGQIATYPIVALELLFTARSSSELEAVDRTLARLRTVPMSAAIARAAVVATKELGSRSVGYHRVTLPDYLIAASAEGAGLGVLHYDHHFDRLAEVMSFESRWIAPPDSL